MIDVISNTHRVSPAAVANAAELKAAKAFEAVLLTGFVQTMLPENLGGEQTSGPGADVWRSFLASALAEQLAEQNVTGLSSFVVSSLVKSREQI